MFFQPTPFDLNFHFLNTNVRITPFFFLTGFILGMPGGGLAGALIWIAALFIAILVHEFGHVYAMRGCGGDGEVVLYGMGGLAIPTRFVWRPDYRQQIWISLAGPLAGFFLAVSILLVCSFAGGQVETGIEDFGLPYVAVFFEGGRFGDFTGTLQALINGICWICVGWGVFNLLPIYPLDGGQAARQIIERFFPADGRSLSLKLSFLVAVVVAIGALMHEQRYIAILTGWMAYGNFQALQVGTPWKRY